MTVLNLGRAAAAFVLSEAVGMRSRAPEFLGASQDVKPGQPLARILASANIQVAVSADAGNTGNGVPVLTGTGYNKNAKPGRYQFTCIAAAANGGKFRGDDPGGVEIGVAVVGVAFAKQVKLTIPDGATDWAVGDIVYVDVDLDAGGEQVVAWDPTATDGTEVAACLPIYAGKTGAGETLPIATMARDAEILGKEVYWPAGVTDEQKETALQQLALNGLIAR